MLYDITYYIPLFKYLSKALVTGNKIWTYALNLLQLLFASYDVFGTKNHFNPNSTFAGKLTSLPEWSIKLASR